jgi:hypothetical protein
MDKETHAASLSHEQEVLTYTKQRDLEDTMLTERTKHKRLHSM